VVASFVACFAAGLQQHAPVAWEIFEDADVDFLSTKGAEYFVRHGLRSLVKDHGRGVATVELSKCSRESKTNRKSVWPTSFAANVLCRLAAFIFFGVVNLSQDLLLEFLLADLNKLITGVGSTNWLFDRWCIE
jgi:hypothetical protein